MKNLNSKKIVLLVVSFVLATALAAGTTLMFLVDDTTPIKNTFQPTEVTCTIEETFANGQKSDVIVRNTGDIDAYLRAKIIINWVNDKGEVLGEAVPTEAYELKIGSDWSLESGYYYYSKRVAPDDVSTNLIDSCVLNSGVEVPAGYHLSVTILADAIQADPASARTAAGWVIK